DDGHGARAGRGVGVVAGAQDLRDGHAQEHPGHLRELGGGRHVEDAGMPAALAGVALDDLAAGLGEGDDGDEEQGEEVASLHGPGGAVASAVRAVEGSPAQGEEDNAPAEDDKDRHPFSVKRNMLTAGAGGVRRERDPGTVSQRAGPPSPAPRRHAGEPPRFRAWKPHVKGGRRMARAAPNTGRWAKSLIHSPVTNLPVTYAEECPTMLNLSVLLEDAARETPDREAVVFGDLRLSYS